MELTGSTGLTNSLHCPHSRLLFSSHQSMRCCKMLVVTLNQQCLTATSQCMSQPLSLPLGHLAAPMQGAGQKQTFLLDDAQPEQNRASKHQKVLTGNKLPSAHTQPLVCHTFQVMHDQSGMVTVTTASQGYGMSVAPIHQPSLQSTGVAGLSFTRPAMPQVISSASNHSSVSPDIPPHSDSVSKADNLGPTMYSAAQMKD